MHQNTQRAFIVVAAVTVIALACSGCSDNQHSQPQVVYQQAPQAPQVVYQQAPHDTGMSAGTAALLGAAAGYMAGNMGNSSNYRAAPEYGAGYYRGPSGEVVQQRIVNNTYVYSDRSGKTVTPTIKPDPVKEQAARSQPTFSKPNPTVATAQIPGRPSNVPAQAVPAPVKAPVFSAPKSQPAAAPAPTSRSTPSFTPSKSSFSSSSSSSRSSSSSSSKR